MEESPNIRGTLAEEPNPDVSSDKDIHKDEHNAKLAPEVLQTEIFTQKLLEHNPKTKIIKNNLDEEKTEAKTTKSKSIKVLERVKKSKAIKLAMDDSFTKSKKRKTSTKNLNNFPNVMNYLGILISVRKQPIRNRESKTGELRKMESPDSYKTALCFHWRV